MKVFITGANGFVGSHLKTYLEFKGMDVFGIGRSECISNFPGYKKIDLLDYNSLKKFISFVRPEVIFNLAGISSVKNCTENPNLCEEINVRGTDNLLQSVVETNLNTKIIIAGSAEVYGSPDKMPITEEFPLNPRNLYAETKIQQENLCNEYSDKLDISILRLFPHIGPGQKPLFVSSDFAKQIVSIERGLEPVIRVGNLKAIRDFSDVRDVVEAYWLAYEKGNVGECYNICSGVVKSINEILIKLLSFSKVKITIEKDENKMRPSDIPILIGDNNKFVKQTGWKPKIPLDKTLNDLLNYWRINKNFT
jgi:GDP-4-dehydro-6-deoxy-D-mannose reductase